MAVQQAGNVHVHLPRGSWWRKNRPVAGELTDDLREDLLGKVRERSCGQLSKLIEIRPGYQSLRLDPTLEYVTAHRAESEPAAPRPVADITDAFAEARGRLLLTGDPGGGKTVLAYKLIEQLIDHPDRFGPAIPVVFNLGGWPRDRPIDDWLIDQLSAVETGYGLPRRVARALVGHHRLAVVLDGLDEVADPNRPGCIHAINAYLAPLPAPPAAPLIITCRTEDYEQLITRHAPSRLALLRAYRARPLAPDVVRSNLVALAPADPRWASPTEVPGSEPIPGALASPLLLTFAIQSGCDPARLTGRSDTDTAMILEAFLDDRLRPDGTNDGADARRWLRWIACFLRNDSPDGITFYFENLTPREVPSYLRSASLAAGLGGGLAVGLAVELSGGLAVDLFGPGVGLAFGLGIGMTLGMIGVLGADCEPTRIRIRWPSRSALRRGLFGGAFAGLMFSEAGLVVRLVYGLTLALVPTLIDTTDVAQTTEPDVGLPLSKRSWLFTGLSVALAFGLFNTLASRLYGGLHHWLALGLAVGLFSGLSVGGGYVIVQYVTRRRLRRDNNLPADPLAFLQWATDVGVMRQVGGGFQFRHRTLRDLLADEPASRPAREHRSGAGLPVGGSAPATCVDCGGDGPPAGGFS